MKREPRKRRHVTVRLNAPEQTPGTPEAPTRGHVDIRSRALLVIVNVKEWSAQVTAEDLRDQLVFDNGIQDAELIRATKSVLPKESLAKLRTAANKITSTFKRWSMPWGNVWSTRILAATAYPDARKEIMDAITEYDALVISELESIGASGQSRYAEAKERAKTLLGGAYRETDYPTLDQVKTRFRASFRTMSIPDGADIRVDLSRDIIDQIRAEEKQFAQDAVTAAMDTLYDEMAAMIERLTAALDEEVVDPQVKVAALQAELQTILATPGALTPEKLAAFETELTEIQNGKKATAIREDLFKSVARFASRVPQLNITGDSRLEALAKKLETLVTTNSAADVRNSVPLKADVKAQAEEILEQVADLY